MMNVKELKKGSKFWCWWLSRNIYFRRTIEDRGVTYYVFEDICDEQFKLTEDMVAKLEKRA